MTPEQIQEAAKQGVGVLFGVVCLWLMFQSERRHQKEITDQFQRQERDTAATNARVEGLVTRLFTVVENNTGAMQSLESAVEIQGTLKELKDEIREGKRGK